MKTSEITLPEFAFLDGHTHQGETLKARTVILHIRSASVIEVFSDEDIVMLADHVPKQTFRYINLFNVAEEHTFAIHYSFADVDDIPDILSTAARWYFDYLRWEDHGIISDSTATQN